MRDFPRVAVYTSKWGRKRTNAYCFRGNGDGQNYIARIDNRFGNDLAILLEISFSLREGSLDAS